MNFDDAVLAVYARLDTGWAASHAGIPVQYENRLLPDFATRIDPFVQCEVMFNGGDQASMGTSPMLRYRGAVWLSVWTKEGGGVKVPATTLGELAALFKTVSFGGVNTRAPVPIPGATKNGWYVLSARVPFWFDQL